MHVCKLDYISFNELLNPLTRKDLLELMKIERIHAELEIAVGHWPFSDQFSSLGQVNPIC